MFYYILEFNHTDTIFVDNNLYNYPYEKCINLKLIYIKNNFKLCEYKSGASFYSFSSMSLLEELL